MKAEAYIASMDRKTTIYGLEAGKIAFFEKRVQAVHNNALPYKFIDLPVSLSLHHGYSKQSRRGFIIQHDTVQAPCDTLVQYSEISWETTCADKIASNSNSIFAGSPGFSLSGSHIMAYYECHKLIGALVFPGGFTEVCMHAVKKSSKHCGLVDSSAI